MCQPHSRARAHIRVHGQCKSDLIGFCCFVLFVFKDECTEWEGWVPLWGVDGGEDDQIYCTGSLKDESEIKIKTRKHALCFSMVTFFPCPPPLNSSPPLCLLLPSFLNPSVCLFLFLGAHSFSIVWNVLGGGRFYYTDYMYISVWWFTGKGGPV